MPAHPNTPWLALSVRYLALVFLVGAVLTSCNRKGDSAQQQTTQRERTTLRLPLDSDVPTMDPIHITDVRSASVARQIFSTLVRYDKDLKLVPDIAERWEVASDKLTLRFYLTKGAKFQNGREVTAEDFVYSLTRLADTKEVSERATLMRDVVGYSDFRSGKAVNLAGLSAPDPYTLQIKLSKPYS
jgi:ABC-type transport system substrate-binding protein